MYHVLITCQALHIPRALVSAQITLPLGSECCSHHPKWSGMSLSNLSKDDKQGTVAWLQSPCSFFPGVLLNVCTSTTVLNPSAVLKAPTSQWQPWGGPLSPQAAPRCCITCTCPQAKGGRRGRQRWWQLTVSATNKNILKGKRSLPEQQGITMGLLKFHSGQHFWKQWILTISARKTPQFWTYAGIEEILLQASIKVKNSKTALQNQEITTCKRNTTLDLEVTLIQSLSTCYFISPKI